MAVALSSPAPETDTTRTSLRIDGDTDTIFEGIIRNGPANVTTASGGTHLCDGTNGHANPIPGQTPTTTLLAAAGLCGFDFDEAFYKQFQLVICGLDSIEARRWINATLVSIAEDGGDADWMFWT